MARPNEPRGAADTSEQPAAQLPQQARPAAPSIQRRPPTRRLEAGDLVCPECGEGNPETRKFCSRCGTSLEAAQVVKRKWWQKLFRKGPKKRKAGDRPSARKTRRSFPAKVMGILFGGVSRVVGIILIVGGLVYGILPNVRSSVNEQFSSITRTVKNWISPSLTTLGPITNTTAVKAVRGHPGSFATDKLKDTYWLAPASPTPTLRLTFPDKINLKKINIYNGPSGRTDYQTYSRPTELHLEFDTNKGCNVSVTHDDPEPHTYNCSANGVTSVTISVQHTTPGKNPQVALTEIQFVKED
ncbi:MAG: hypothetical protein QOG01_2275 [Pseudonocardiales bacterium]|nr:hypothetical protein [Pseudonocardiales bacterium]